MTEKEKKRERKKREREREKEKKGERKRKKSVKYSGSPLKFLMVASFRKISSEIFFILNFIRLIKSQKEESRREDGSNKSWRTTG